MSIDIEKAVALLSARNITNCPVCGMVALTVCEHLVTLAKYEGQAGEYFMGRNYPQLMVVCLMCDHTMLFNAQRLGLREGGPQV